MAVKAYSFDVYDTCLSRFFSRPQDLFLELARRVLREGPATGSPTNSPGARAVASRRILAERNALIARRPREAVTLEDIYRHLRLPPGLSLDRGSMLQEELALEESAVFAVSEMVQRIASLRAAGERILFVSDMYLPAAFIGGLLVRLGIATGEEPLYVSGEIGLTKRSGRLFEHVLRAERLGASELLHCGDNPHTDVFPARRLGIRSEHTGRTKLGRYESHLAEGPPSDLLTRSRIAGTSRAVRLTRPSKGEPTGEALHDLFTGAIAPFLTAFTAWVLESATRSKVQRLYFLARDGQVLLKIAEVLSQYMEAPELRYLYGSRQAWLLPSIDFTRSEWHHLVITPGQPNRPIDIIRRLGFQPAEVRSVLDRQGSAFEDLEETSDKDSADRLMHALIQDPETGALLRERVEKSRAVTLAYLSQERLLGEQKWALVDTGWRLQCQAALDRILGSVPNRLQRPCGYYIALAADRLAPEIAGEAIPFLKADNPVFCRRRVVVEHLFTPSDQPPTIGYRKEGDRVVPTFGDTHLGDMQIDRVRELHSAVVEYADQIGRSGILGNGVEVFRQAAIDTASLLLTRPSRGDAEIAARIAATAEIRQTTKMARPLASRIALGDLPRMIAADILPNLDYRERVTLWPEASAALSSPAVRIALAILARMKRLRGLLR